MFCYCQSMWNPNEQMTLTPIQRHVLLDGPACWVIWASRQPCSVTIAHHSHAVSEDETTNCYHHCRGSYVWKKQWDLKTIRCVLNPYYSLLHWTCRLGSPSRPAVIPELSQMPRACAIAVHVCPSQKPHHNLGNTPQLPSLQPTCGKSLWYLLRARWISECLCPVMYLLFLPACRTRALRSILCENGTWALSPHWGRSSRPSRSS